MKTNKLTKQNRVVENNSVPNGKESNLVKKVTLEVLNKKHNALARYIGIPCVVEASEVKKGAVMADGGVNDVKNFACYRVDLKPFKGEFDKIRFRAASNGKDIAFAMLLDNNDSLEYVAKSDEPGECCIVMPLTANSKTLYATMPAKNGKPAWKNPTVELLTKGGVIANVNNALSSLLERIQALEERIETISV